MAKGADGKVEPRDIVDHVERVGRKLGGYAAGVVVGALDHLARLGWSRGKVDAEDETVARTKLRVKAREKVDCLVCRVVSEVSEARAEEEHRLAPRHGGHDLGHRVLVGPDHGLVGHVLCARLKVVVHGLVFFERAAVRW